MSRDAVKPDADQPVVGVGLKPEHVQAILAERPDIGFFEVHAENYMGSGGPPHRHLAAIRALYPLSIHGVGLSLGGAGGLDMDHLDRLAALVERYEPILVSEHLAWSTHAGHYLNDLLPIPYSHAALSKVVENVDQVQTRLRRPILLENPSTYIAFEESVFEETAFIAEVAKRTGCGLLLDVTNVHVSSTNHGRDAGAYLNRFPISHVQELHLAGHSVRLDSHGVPLLVDSHDQPVAAEVWALYQRTVDRTGAVPTLIERDAHIPPWSELHGEALHARSYMTGRPKGGELAVAC